MTATLETAPRASQAQVTGAEPKSGGPRRSPRLRHLWLAVPCVLAVLNAVAFVLVRPDVNDLWAARARASAVSDGVGLTYWFSWFGGSTPGNYSVLTPYLCSYLGTEVVGALAAVAATVLAALLVRRTPHPFAATTVAMVAAAVNLWSGRVPFLLGAAVAAGALVALVHRRRAAAVVLTVVAMAASPVAGVFVALGLSGTFLTTRTRDWRPIIAWVAGATAVVLVAVVVLFGAPGAEPFDLTYALEAIGGLVLLRLMNPPDHLRTTIWTAMLAIVVLWAVPNGLGANGARFVWFCLPVAVVAFSARRTTVAALLVLPLLAAGSASTLRDLRDASAPMASTAYFTPLADKLDVMPQLRNYRLEVVDQGQRNGYHAGYSALLGHASLARGWETQEDGARNASLYRDPLNPVTYKVWLDNNAVGYVAVPAARVAAFPERTLVRGGRARYLHRVWHDRNWTLYRVQNATPIIAAPATITTIRQSSMTIQVPCACTVHARLRWSKFLSADLLAPGANGADPAPAIPPAPAVVRDDGNGWTTITTTRPGAYQLRGSLSGIFHE